MKHYIILTLSCSFIFCSCSLDSKAKAEYIDLAIDTTTKAEVISLGALVRGYNSLNGEIIQTEGILYFEFENVAICLGRGRNAKCFWLEFNENLFNSDSLLQNASGKEFILKGTVDNSNKGHLNAYLATIKNVYYLKQK